MSSVAATSFKLLFLVVHGRIYTKSYDLQLLWIHFEFKLINHSQQPPLSSLVTHMIYWKTFSLPYKHFENILQVVCVQHITVSVFSVCCPEITIKMAIIHCPHSINSVTDLTDKHYMPLNKQDQLVLYESSFVLKP